MWPTRSGYAALSSECGTGWDSTRFLGRLDLVCCNAGDQLHLVRFDAPKMLGIPGSISRLADSEQFAALLVNIREAERVLFLS
jgi:hypothetical protein